MPDRVTAEFEDFARARTTALYRQAWSLCGDRHLAEDLVQDTLAKLYVKWRRVDTPYAYAQTTLVRTFISQRRRRSSTEQPWAEPPEHLGAGGVTDPTERHALRVTLTAALGELSAKDRAVLVLRFLEDLSVEETALRMGTSVGAVKNRTQRALAHIREESLR